MIFDPRARALFLNPTRDQRRHHQAVKASEKTSMTEQVPDALNLTTPGGPSPSVSKPPRDGGPPQVPENSQSGANAHLALGIVRTARPAETF